MHDLFETCIACQIVNVVAAIGKAPFLALDVAEQGVSDDDAFEAAIDDDTGGRQLLWILQVGARRGDYGNALAHRPPSVLKCSGISPEAFGICCAEPPGAWKH